MRTSRLTAEAIRKPNGHTLETIQAFKHFQRVPTVLALRESAILPPTLELWLVQEKGVRVLLTNGTLVPDRALDLQWASNGGPHGGPHCVSSWQGFPVSGWLLLRPRRLQLNRGPNQAAHEGVSPYPPPVCERGAH